MTREEILQKTRAFLFDLDGTLYLGGTPIGDSVNTLKRLRAANKRVVFLTNNSSKTQAQYREKLARVGLYEPGDVVYTSGMAAIARLKGEYPGKKVYLLGTEAVRAEFAAAGIPLTEREPSVCVLAYDVELTFEKIKTFDGFLRRGAVFWATHPDDVCPTDDLPVPDVGSFLALFERSCGRRPDLIVGKPFFDMAEGVSEALGLRREELCMVGDRMHTDIRFANKNGMMSVLVLSGETTPETMKNFPDRADLVLGCVGELLPEAVS